MEFSALYKSSILILAFDLFDHALGITGIFVLCLTSFMSKQGVPWYNGIRVLNGILFSQLGCNLS